MAIAYPLPKTGGKGSDFSWHMDPAGIVIEALKPQARLSDLVQTARSICDVVVKETIERGGQEGRTITCRKGCWACCRYLVPVSTPEAVAISEELQLDLSMGNRDLMKSMLASAAVVLKAPVEGMDPADISQWYSSLKLECPLLADGICSIYQQRPLACREYMITGAAAACYGDRSHAASNVWLPVSTAEALAQAAAIIENGRTDAVILPFSPAWYQANLTAAMRSYPADALAQAFSNALNAGLAQDAIHASAR